MAVERFDNQGTVADTQKKPLADVLHISLPWLEKGSNLINACQLVFALIFFVATGMSTVAEDKAFDGMSGFSLLMGGAFGLFGAYKRNRSFLIFVFIVQIWVLATTTPFFYEGFIQWKNNKETCKNLQRAAGSFDCAATGSLRKLELSIAGLSLVTALFAAWVAMRLSEQLQAEGVPPRGGLPFITLTESRFKTVMLALSGLQMVMCIVVFVLAGIASSEEVTNFNVLFGVALFISTVCTIYGSKTSDRGFLMLAFIVQVWYLTFAKNYIFVATFNKGKSDSTCATLPKTDESCAQNGAAENASIALALISFLASLAGAWASLRFSEFIEDLNSTRGQEAQPSSGGGGGIFNLPDQTVRSLSMIQYGVMVLQLAMSVSMIALGAVIGVFESMLFDVMFGLILFFAVFVGFYAVKMGDRGVLTIYFIIQMWGLGSLSVFLYSSIVERKRALMGCAATADPNCSWTTKVYNTQVGLPVIIFVGLLISCWVSLRLSEKISEEYGSGGKPSRPPSRGPVTVNIGSS